MGTEKISFHNIPLIKKTIKDGNEWILNSGIQNKIKLDKNYGGYHAWIDFKSQKFSYLYSEITGYLITYNCFIYTLTKNKKNLIAAEIAANWLIKRAQLSFGGFRCFELIDKNLKILDKSNLTYSFDNGVILNGLINLYKITKKKKYLNSANKCGDWLIKCKNLKTGKIKPVYDFKKKKFIYNSKSWSMVSGSYHTKISIGLFNLYSITKQKKYSNLAKIIIKESLKLQKPNGMFPSTKFHLNLHPHCYSAEGIWVNAKLFEKNSCFNSVKLAVKWALKEKKNKIPPRLFFPKSKKIFYYRVDAISQVLRLLILLKLDKKILNHENDIDNLMSIIFTNISKSKKKLFKGAFFWGYQSSGKKSNSINVWTTIFIIQTLIYILNFNSKKKINPFHII